MPSGVHKFCYRHFISFTLFMIQTYHESGGNMDRKKFDQRLDEAMEIVPLTVEHCGACADILKPVKSGLKKSSQKVVAKHGLPPTTHSNLRRERVKLSDDVIRESEYSIDQARGQLDGIIKQWMNLSSRFPAGSVEQDKFIEIGKRLTEISQVIQRDFIEGGAMGAESGTLDTPGAIQQAPEELPPGQLTPGGEAAPIADIPL